MLHKTRGIVLHSIPYSDKYFIINMYTELFGRVSYMVPNTHNKKTKIPHALLAPLSILNLEINHQNNREIQRIREARTEIPLTQIYRNPSKNAIALFLSEILYRVIQEKESNPQLFKYIADSIQKLDASDSGIANFHLVFLLQLSNYIGIRPNFASYKTGRYFDLQDGVFSEAIPKHNNYLNQEESIILARLMKINFENMSIFIFSRTERANIIRHIIDYYRLHLTDFPEIKSLAVMQSLFN